MVHDVYLIWLEKIGWAVVDLDLDLQIILVPLGVPKPKPERLIEAVKK